MDIRYCTITGADDRVQFSDLRILSEAYPTVEWGILSSYGMEGTSRFPSEAWINRFIGQAPASMNRSLHLCGASLTAFLKGEMWMRERMRPFQRVQLNLNSYEETPDLAERLATQIETNAHKTFIFQMSGATEKLYPAIQSMGNVQVLFDASNGIGKAPLTWPMPKEGQLCGYAGGLTVKNVRGHLKAIEDKMGEGQIGAGSFWVDVETGVRTGKGHFSRQLAEAFLEAVYPSNTNDGKISPRAQSRHYTYD